MKFGGTSVADINCIKNVAEKVANKCLNLPISPYLSAQDQTLVFDTVS